MSDSARPHRWQPTRLPRPWDSPGKNTGVGCHFLLQCMKVKSESEVTQSCPTLHEPMDCSPPGSSVHGIFQARVLEWGAISFSDCKSSVQYKINKRYPCDSDPQLKFGTIACNDLFPIRFKFHSRVSKLKWLTKSTKIAAEYSVDLSSQKWSEVKSLSRVRLFVTPWTVAYQAPPSMGFSRQGYWSGLSFPSPGDLPNLGIELWSLALQADALPSEPPGKLSS